MIQTHSDSNHDSIRLNLDLRVLSADQENPWILWLNSRLNQIPGINARLKTGPPRTSSNQDRLTRWSMLTEQRLAKTRPWPKVSSSPELPAVIPDVVVDLTGSVQRRHGDFHGQLWWLLAVSAFVTPNGLQGYLEAKSRIPTIHVMLYAQSIIDKKALLIAETRINTKLCGAMNSQNILSTVPMLIEKGLKTSSRIDNGDSTHAVHPVDDVSAKSSVSSEQRVSTFDRIKGMLRLQYVTRSEDVKRRLNQRPGMWSLYFGTGEFLSHSLADLTEARPPGNEYWADPFLWEHDGSLYVFFEAYDYGTSHGRIAVGLWSDNRLTVCGDALALPHHLSYPFLIQHEDALLLIPESCAANRVEIWQCVQFPTGFTRIATCFEGMQIADLTLFCRDEQWWAFCCSAKPGSRNMNSELYAFAVEGPLMQHPVAHSNNPIVTDCRYARPAGRIFQKHGIWYRPSQNNSHGVYGYGLNLMQITTLTMDEYSEQPVRQVQPDFVAGLKGTHHLDQQQCIFVMDACHAVGGRVTKHSTAVLEYRTSAV